MKITKNANPYSNALNYLLDLLLTYDYIRRPNVRHVLYLINLFEKNENLSNLDISITSY